MMQNDQKQRTHHDAQAEHVGRKVAVEELLNEGGFRSFGMACGVTASSFHMLSRGRFTRVRGGRRFGVFRGGESQRSEGHHAGTGQQGEHPFEKQGEVHGRLISAFRARVRGRHPWRPTGLVEGRGRRR